MCKLLLGIISQTMKCEQYYTTINNNNKKTAVFLIILSKGLSELFFNLNVCLYLNAQSKRTLIMPKCNISCGQAPNNY